MEEIGEVLERLDRVLPERAPWLHAGWRPPVTDADLDVLRMAIDPYSLPPEVEAFLRWHDGQEERSWWPGFMGYVPFDPAALLARHYTDRRVLMAENAPDLEGDLDYPYLTNLLPLTWHGWGLWVLELDAEHKRAVVDNELSNTHYIVEFPSLAALLDVVADMAEAGLLDHDIPSEEWAGAHPNLVAAINGANRKHRARAWAFPETSWSLAPGPGGYLPPRPERSKSDTSDWPEHWKAHLRGDAAALTRFGPDTKSALAVLSAYASQPDAAEISEVFTALLSLADGNLDRLRELAEQADLDHQSVIELAQRRGPDSGATRRPSADDDRLPHGR